MWKAPEFENYYSRAYSPKGFYSFASRLIFTAAIITIALGSLTLAAETAEEPDERSGALKVFLDFNNYQEYIKLEIPFVDYVRDRKEAQVHIMMTRQETGSGGREYTLTFIGQQNFTGLDDTLKCTTRQHDTEEIIRGHLVRTLKMGLVRYVSKTPLATDISIDYLHRTDPAAVVDKWDYWVFNIESEVRTNGEESNKEMSLDGSFSADRVTPEWKMSFNVDADYNKEEDDTDDGTVSSFRRSQEFESLIVKSHGEHFSFGGYASARSSIYSNTRFAFSVAPAVEYNVFPYSESTHREFRILYRVDYRNVQYNEETLYKKMRESLFDENLSATFEIKERWGSARSTLEGSHYFHDFSKNRLRLYTNLNLRLYEGFSLNIRSNIERIHDQLSLPREDMTTYEILLNQKQRATQYEYFIEVGIRYTFGSIYSNVVNPRFGN